MPMQNHILPVGPTCDAWSLFWCAQVASGSCDLEEHVLCPSSMKEWLHQKLTLGGMSFFSGFPPKMDDD